MNAKQKNNPETCTLYIDTQTHTGNLVKLFLYCYVFYFVRRLKIKKNKKNNPYDVSPVHQCRLIDIHLIRIMHIINLNSTEKQNQLKKHLDDENN